MKGPAELDCLIGGRIVKGPPFSENSKASKKKYFI
jgi:hypothetical protein